MSTATKTTDHEAIRRWVEARDGHPATVSATRDDQAGILRIAFDGAPPEGLERISWARFFATFDDSKLAFLHQDLTESGQTSRFCKLVRRD